MAQNKTKIGKGGVSLAETPKYKGYVKEIIKMILDGYHSYDMYSEIIAQEPEMKEGMFNRLLMKAYASVRNKLHRDREYTFQLHLSRYEDLYKRTMQLTDRFHRELDINKHIGPIISKISDALKILKNKEDLVGLHDRNLILEVTTKETTIVRDEAKKGKGKEHSGYDIDKLTLEEKIELLETLSSIRTVPIEGVRQTVIKRTMITVTEGSAVTHAQLVRPNETIDVVYEEMPEKVVHKLQEVKTNIGPEYINSPIIEDLVDRTIQPKTIEQLRGKIDDDLKSKFEKLIKRTKPAK